jgi:biofilm PGA synthesis protein PgaD
MEDFFKFLATIFKWVVFHEQTPELAAALGVLRTMEYYLLIIIINSCILLGWAMYNLIRFRGKDRRKPLPAIGAPDLARLYNVQTQEVIEWQKLNILTMYHDAYGNLIKIEPK